jgi:hypothetical protein
MISVFSHGLRVFMPFGDSLPTGSLRNRKICSLSAYKNPIESREIHLNLGHPSPRIAEILGSGGHRFTPNSRKETQV